MKKLWLVVVATCALSSNTFGAVNCEHAQGVADEEFAILDEDGGSWNSYCYTYDKDESFNDYDLGPKTTSLLAIVDGDPAARGAMEIFLESDYRKFVDYCKEYLYSMTEPYQQIFKDVLIMLAPGICSSEYARIMISLVGRNRNDVRAADIQNLPFCLDMFFYAAVRNGQLGRYALAKMCIDAFYAPCLKWEKGDMFDTYNIRYATFGRWCFDDWPEIPYSIDSIWPNWE